MDLHIHLYINSRCQIICRHKFTAVTRVSFISMISLVDILYRNKKGEND